MIKCQLLTRKVLKHKFGRKHLIQLTLTRCMACLTLVSSLIISLKDFIMSLPQLIREEDQIKELLKMEIWKQLVTKKTDLKTGSELTEGTTRALGKNTGLDISKYNTINRMTKTTGSTIICILKKIEKSKIGTAYPIFSGVSTLKMYSPS